MTLYETLFVVHPERGSRMKEFIEKFKKVIEGQEGTVSLVDEWGMRDLAYRIDKQSKAFMPCCVTRRQAARLRNWSATSS